MHSLLAALFIAVICQTAVPAHGHGYLYEPRSRNWVAYQSGTFYDPQSGNGLGTGSAAAPGVCGDPFQGTNSNFAGAAFSPIMTYAQGSVITLKARLTANHGGKFSFRICPRSSDLTQDCFGTNYLLRVDNGQADTWILNSTMDYTMTYQLPATISCDAGCVLQWEYFAMQSCIQPNCNPLYCKDYAQGINPVYGGNPGFCSASSARPEYFYNCADVIIASSGGNGTSNPSPTPSPSPSPAPVPSPPSPGPSPSPSPAPPATETCPTAPGPARAACVCQGKAAGYYVDTFNGCTGYSWCYGAGQSTYQLCPSGLLFNQATSQCDWPSNVVCAGSPSSSPSPSPSPSSPSPTPSPSPSPLPSPSPSPSPAPSTACGGCSDAPCYCRLKGTGDFANPFDSTCSTFLKCSNGAATVTSCPSGLMFDAAAGVCNWPAAVTCTPGCSTGSNSPSPSSPSPAPSSPSPAPSSPSPAPSSPSPAPGPAPVNPLLPSGQLLVGYYQSWSAKWSSVGADLDLARTPSYVNVVIVSFAQPDCSYTKGSYSLSGTGLQFSSDGSVVRAAIAALKSRQPNTRVLLAVGGATYTNFAGMKTQCLKDLVDDFGFDGIDFDYEPHAGCTISGGKVSCPSSDSESVQSLTALRNTFPKGSYILSTATFHVGCYGEGAYAASKPITQYTGVNLAMARSAAGQSLDLVNIMAYDAGNKASTGFDPLESFASQRAVFPSAAVALGVEVPPEAWGGNVVSLDQVQAYSTHVKANGGRGMMLWSLHKKGTPSAAAIANTVCTTLGMASCEVALPF